MIKKTLAVILSLMLLMSLTSALAASSKTNTDISHGTVEVPGVLIQIVKVPDTDFTKKLKLEVAAAQEKGNILEAHDNTADKRVSPENHQAQNKGKHKYKGCDLLRIKKLLKLAHPNLL